MLKSLLHVQTNVYKLTRHKFDWSTMEPLQTVEWSKLPRPFVKWAGGKRQLLEALERHFPETFGTYYESFLGGGAVFFYLVGKRSRFNAVLSDINEELINTYRVIKAQVEDLITRLELYKANYEMAPESYYYEARADEPQDDVERAARLIFLNRTCYNGLYRVNSAGKFNVPFGRYKNPRIVDKENLRTVSKVLNRSNAELLSVDYQEATKNAKEGDFIYFDPPYQPVSVTANFTSYTDSGFSIKDQERLGDWFRKLGKRGCKILLSNSDTEQVVRIYNGYDAHRVQALRAISCKGDQRKGHTELIIVSDRS
jgi:DNA adenine methylase